jgi:hypothetical protein
MLATASTRDPTTWTEALSRANAADWLAAGKVRINELEANGVWRKVNRSSVPPGQRVLHTKPVFKTKYHADGSFDKLSVRIAVKGYEQIKGVDYNDIFSPVASYETFRVTLSVAAAEDCDVIPVYVDDKLLICKTRAPSPTT